LRKTQIFQESARWIGGTYRRHPRRWLIGGAGAALVLATILTWALWPTTPPEAPRARVYLEFTACLLTGEDGLADPAAAPVWAGLEEASLATHAKIQYLAVVGPQTVENAQTFLNSLALAGCNLVFAAGDLAVATTDRAAHDHPTARFFPVGAAANSGDARGAESAGNAPQPNVTPITATTPEQIRVAVRDTLAQAVAAQP
jgi:hypothetical protein